MNDTNYERNHMDDLILVCRKWRAKGVTFHEVNLVLAFVYLPSDVFLAWKAAEILDP